MDCVRVPSSKSMLHRLVIAAALSRGADILGVSQNSGVIGDEDLSLRFDGMNEDVEATMDCMRALLGSGEPINLYCGESGSTLRFLLPLVGVFGKACVFHMEGRLSKRPLSPYDDELRRHGMSIERDESKLVVSGRLQPGDFVLPGNISSQYITGLLIALPLLDGDSRITISSRLESSAYVGMTLDVLRLAGIKVSCTNDEDSCNGVDDTFAKDPNIEFKIEGGQKYMLKGEHAVEGDYSSAAFFLCLGALRWEGISVIGLNHYSNQGDRRVIEILREFGADVTEIDGGYEVRRNRLEGIRIDARQIPDLVPALAIVAAFAEGRTEIVNGERLRYKESDRIKSTVSLLRSIGTNARELEDGLVIDGAEHLPGGCVDSQSDHRIAMAAGIASVVCDGVIEISNKECVGKSYPNFWRDLDECIQGQNN